MQITASVILLVASCRSFLLVGAVVNNNKARAPCSAIYQFGAKCDIYWFSILIIGILFLPLPQTKCTFMNITSEDKALFELYE